ncbi:MAG: PQ-loop domain-containing transporter [Candidatus Woesearchaeota archaeon]
MQHVTQHIHKRKRIHQEFQEYPHPDAKVRMVDAVSMFVAVVMPFIAIPQIYKVFSEKTAAGVSIWFWIFAFFLQMPMLAYGIVHKSKQIIIYNILWLIADAIMVVGVAVYG